MYRYKENHSKKWIKVLIGVLIFLWIGLLAWLLYQKYDQIDINQFYPKNSDTYTAEKAGKTVEEVKKQSKEVADIIEEVTKTVVGISKIKNAGNTIFLKDSATSLGLGTGILVSDNGYILTNEHVSRK